MDCDSKITNTGVYGKSLGNWLFVIQLQLLLLELAIMCGTDYGQFE